MVAAQLAADLEILRDWAATSPPPDDEALPTVIATAADNLAALADANDPELQGMGIKALFADFVEWCNDRFDPRLRAWCDAVMARVCWDSARRDPVLANHLAVCGIGDDRDLWRRQRRLLETPAPKRAPERIAIPSRVTLGADILLTSVLVQQLHARWPECELLLLGDAKLAGLFAGHPRLQVHPLRYTRRGRLGDRLHSSLALDRALLDHHVDLVVNPDSRLDQLGLDAAQLASISERVAEKIQ